MKVYCGKLGGDEMKIVEIKCKNQDCANFGKYTQIDLFDFVWDVNFIDGEYPRNLFFELPSEIHCQNCLNLCTFEIREKI